MLLAVGVHDPGLIGAFAGGMLSFLSPCVLPLVPGYLSMVSGISVAELQAGDHGNVRRIVVSTLLFVAGFTAVFVALGAAARGVGQALRQHQWGLGVITGVAFDRMAGAFSFVKRHFRVINLVAGALLFAFGFLLFTHRLTRLSSYFTDALHWLHLDALTKI